MSIIGSLPYNLLNGTTADATQVMADLNTIINGVNNTTTGAASIPQVQTNSLRYAADSGSVNAIIIGVSPSPVLTDGMDFSTKAANTNTSTTVTAQVGSGVAKGVVVDQAGTLPAIGSIIAGMYYRLQYSSALDKYILMNPSRATGSATLTYTGMTTTVTPGLTYSISPDGSTFFCKIAGATGTSNNVATTLTGVPAVLSSSNNNMQPLKVTDAGASTIGNVSGLNGTTWTLGLAGSNGNFTASGIKGIAATNATSQFSYAKDL